MYQEDALQPWVRALRAELPGLEVFDAHVHVGTSDPAGYQADRAEVLESLVVAGARAAVFPVADPSGYRGANDAVLELAAEHPDRVTAFARLDPADEAAAEARRCVAAGARGLKLHPRGDDFAIADHRLDDVFALADRERLPVVVHAGVGDPEIGGQAVDRARAHPSARVVLAHCAIGAFEEIVPHIHETPNLLVDTSWWNLSDVWAVLRLVPANQVLHGSDVPFNSPTQGLLTSGRLALQAGLTSEQVRRVLGGTMRCVVDGQPLPDAGPTPGPAEPLAPELERLYVTLCSAVVPMLAGGDGGEGLELARAACRAPSDEHRSTLDNVAELLDLVERCTGRDPLRPLRAPGFDLVLTAALVARTPDAANP